MKNHSKLFMIAYRIITGETLQANFRKNTWIDDINILDENFLILSKQSKLSSTRRKIITKACKEYSKVFSPVTHELKTIPESFLAVGMEIKKMELRLNDRKFETGHTLILKEWDPINKYSGDEIVVQVTHVFDQSYYPFLELKNHVIMSIKL